MAQVLRVGLEKVRVATEDAYKKGFQAGLAKGREEGRRDGIQEGWELVEAEYTVTYFCSRCGRQHLTITSREEKDAAADLMYEAGWHDPTCPER